MFEFPRALPEEVGISSRSILDFIRKLEQYDLAMHSILIARNGKLIAETYHSPYDADTLHRMFSVSKSFTSIAVGLLSEEGKLDLDDRIADYFPDLLPDKIHPFIAEMTIRNMLKMQTCHTFTTYKDSPDSDWVRSFFTTLPSHRPGTSFNYDTSASHTLCALVERLTAKSLLEYLRECCLDEIGFSKEAYMLKDPFGISMGGSGLMAKPRDLLLFAQLIMNGGSQNGKQLLPKDYIHEALSHQSDTMVTMPVLEERQGYGYQFWRIRNNGFACYGMGGQLAVCLPEQALILVTTADTIGTQGGNQLIYNSFYDEVLACLSDAPMSPDQKDEAELDNYLKTLAIKPLEVTTLPPLMAAVHEKPYHLEENPSNFSFVSLEFDSLKKEGVLNLAIGGKIHHLLFGFGHTVVSTFPIYLQKCASSATWLSENTLYIKSHIIDECIGSVQFHLTFIDNTVSIFMKKIEETYFNEFTGYLYGIHH